VAKNNGSLLSIGSSGSILSIGSSGSILSIGSAGSILSIGSAGSFASVLSACSFVSFASVLSGFSTFSVRAWGAGTSRPGKSLTGDRRGRVCHEVKIIYSNCLASQLPEQLRRQTVN